MVLWVETWKHPGEDTQPVEWCDNPYSPLPVLQAASEPVACCLPWNAFGAGFVTHLGRQLSFWKTVHLCIHLLHLYWPRVMCLSVYLHVAVLSETRCWAGSVYSPNPPIPNPRISRHNQLLSEQKMWIPSLGQVVALMYNILLLLEVASETWGHFPFIIHTSGYNFLFN